MVEILKGVDIRDLALWFQKEKTLVVADFHIGYEEALNKEGVLVPRFQCRILEKRLKNLLRKLEPSAVIINGDLKHEFGTISEQEWREALKVLDLIGKHCNSIILVKGNHDTIMGPIAKKKSIKVVSHAMVGGCYISHGHKLPKDHDYKKAKNVIIAHEHPAVSLREGGKSEKFKCFLKGEYDGKDLVVMPSFNFVTDGSDVLKERLLSPFLQRNLDSFRVFIACEQKVYDFRTLGYVRKKH